MGIHLERRSDGAKVVLIQVEQQKHEEVVLCSGCSSSYFLVLGANWTTRGRGQELDLWGMDMCVVCRYQKRRFKEYHRMGFNFIG